MEEYDKQVGLKHAHLFTSRTAGYLFDNIVFFKSVFSVSAAVRPVTTRGWSIPFLIGNIDDLQHSIKPVM